MKIKYALGKVTTKRAGLKFIRKGSGVQINIINKSEIEVKKSVIALMPNFIHSLDASNIHNLTDFLHNLKIAEIKQELKKEITNTKYLHLNLGYLKSEKEKNYLIKKYTFNSNSTKKKKKNNKNFDI